MISYNILGDCVSRDIIQPLIVKNEVLVQQFCSFSSPVSLFSAKPEKMLLLEDFPGDIANFHKRCAMLDFNKQVFEYLFEKQADYLILDILDARLNLLYFQNHYVTMAKYMQLYAKEIGYPMEQYDLIKAFDISNDLWENLILQLCKKILQHYPVSKIILHKHFYASKTLLKNGNIVPFQCLKETIDKTNTLCIKLFKFCESFLKGCHIINFPDNVIADNEHKCGPSALHYHDLYYEYGANALKIINKNLPSEIEQLQLEELRTTYSEKFELVYCKAQLKLFQNKFWATNEALNFAKKLNYDWLEGEKFKQWLDECKTQNKKITILNSEDVAGKILKKALLSYNIKILFETSKSDFTGISTEQIEIIKQSDIIVSANIHKTSLPTLYDKTDFPKVILFSDLII